MKRVDGVKPPSFVPFTLLIESEDEARLIAGLIGASNNKVTRAIGVTKDSVACAMYNQLDEYNVKPYAIKITVQEKE